MRLGIGSYAYTWSLGVPGQPRPTAPMGPEDLIDTAAEHGVNVVQLCDNVPLPDFDDAAVQRLARRARERCVTLEAGVRGTEHGFLRRMIEVTSSLGARLLRTMVTDTIAQAESELRQVLLDLERSDMTLAIENYERHSVQDLAGLLRRLESPRVGACLDTVNSFGALEAPREVITSLMPLAVSLHVKDFDVVRSEHRMGFSVVGTRPEKAAWISPRCSRRLPEAGETRTPSSSCGRRSPGTSRRPSPPSGSGRVKASCI